MPLDPFWDKPQYSEDSLQTLKKELETKSTEVAIYKSEMELIFAQEVEIRRQLEALRRQRDEIQAKKVSAETDYNKLRTIEIEWLEEMKRQEELARLNGEISALEKQIEELCKDAQFWNAILPFQKEDVLYAVNAWKMGLTGVLNANDMGLGKTFETLAMWYIISKLFEEKHERPMTTIWVTKKSLIKSTVRELAQWEKKVKVLPVAGNLDKNTKSFLIEMAHENGMILITNYEALSTMPEIIEDYTWDMVVMDEVHKLKGGASYSPTQVWKNARDLVHKSRASGGFYLPLSGSPISNHPKEMWAYLHLFDPVRFPNAAQFERRYCSGYNMGFAVNFDLLIKAMKSQVIRRRKDEVSIQLPELTYDRREVEMGDEQRKVYEMMRKDFFIWLDEQGEDVPLSATAVIAQLNRLRQINLWPDALTNKPTGSAKIDEAMDIILELNAAGEQVVVFSSQFNDPLYEIQSRCKAIDISVDIVAGATKDVDGLCEDFRQGKVDVLCVNMKSGGEGLNLQKSDRWPGGSAHAIFLDLWWNPSVNEQAEARIYRKGANQPVTMHIIQTEGSVDAFIQAKLDEKIEMITGVMEDKSFRKNDWKTTLEGLI